MIGISFYEEIEEGKNMVVDFRQKALKYFLAWKGAQMVLHFRPPQKPRIPMKH